MYKPRGLGKVIACLYFAYISEAVQDISKISTDLSTACPCLLTQHKSKQNIFEKILHC